MPIVYVGIRFSAHATEDPNKVLETVQRVLPVDYGDKIVFKRSNLKGHYGNPISLFETRIKRREIINAVIENFSLRLKEADKEVLLRDIDLHVHNGSFYLRLDKQAAFQGELRLCTADPIRVRIRFRKKKIEDVIQICRELGLLL